MKQACFSDLVYVSEAHRLERSPEVLAGEYQYHRNLVSIFFLVVADLE